MIYESAKTPKGNIGVSYESQELANLQARRMDELDCYNCYNCENGFYCYNCENCDNCIKCNNCNNCNDCNNCDNCDNCDNSQGVLKWTGEAASNLLALNGLIWPIAISETHLQIGCQNHSHESWENFSDEIISRMDYRALEFWKTHKEFIMSTAKYKKGISS